MTRTVVGYKQMRQPSSVPKLYGVPDVSADQMTYSDMLAVCEDSQHDADELCDRPDVVATLCRLLLKMNDDLYASDSALERALMDVSAERAAHDRTKRTRDLEARIGGVAFGDLLAVAESRKFMDDSDTVVDDILGIDIDVPDGLS